MEVDQSTGTGMFLIHREDQENLFALLCGLSSVLPSVRFYGLWFNRLPKFQIVENRTVVFQSKENTNLTTLGRLPV